MTTREAAASATSAPPSRGLRLWAAFVSVIFPGLGQAVLGDRRRGLAFAAAALAWGIAYRASPYGATRVPSAFWPPVVSALLLAGVGLALGAAADAFFRRPRAAAPLPASRRWLVYVAIAAVPAVPGLAVPETWVHYVVPSASMLPTLLVGDHVLAVEGYYAGTAPARGDLAAFRFPRDPRVLFIKRIIGLPGDRVQVKDGALILNDAPVAIERGADFVAPGPGCRPGRYPAIIETLPGGRRYVTLHGCGAPLYENTGIFAVPQGHYFVLGDNRDDSIDSRDPDGGVGFVAAADLVARPVFVTYSLSDQLHFWAIASWPASFRWSRTDRLLD